MARVFATKAYSRDRRRKRSRASRLHLLDRRRYPVPDLADVYHARWGLEELDSVSKLCLEIAQSHGHSERLVKQELFAHFNLIAMTRLFTNRDDRLEQAAQPTAGKPTRQANFNHSLAALAQHLEALLLRHSAYLGETLERISEVGRQRAQPTAAGALVPAPLTAPGLEMATPSSHRDLADPLPPPSSMS